MNNKAMILGALYALAGDSGGVTLPDITPESVKLEHWMSNLALEVKRLRENHAKSPTDPYIKKAFDRVEKKFADLVASLKDEPPCLKIKARSDE